MPRGPDFLIIGVQKGGTESALQYFASHPALFLPRQELHFFSSPRPPPFAKYEAHFRRAKPSQLCGEKTPIYAYLDHCMPRIAERYPKAKLILFLRDPVRRALSQLNMEVQRSNAHVNEASLLRELEEQAATLAPRKTYSDCVRRGLYLEQIQRVLQHFPRDQLYIAFSEEVKRAPRAAYDAIFAWLGVAKMPPRVSYREHHARAQYRVHVADTTVARLARYYAEPNRQLFAFLGLDEQRIAQLGWTAPSSS